MSGEKHSDLRLEHCVWLKPQRHLPRHLKNLTYNVWDDITSGNAGLRNMRAARIAQVKAEAQANDEPKNTQDTQE